METPPPIPLLAPPSSQDWRFQETVRLRNQREDDEDENAVAEGGDDSSATPNTRQATKALTAQIKDMAVKASGAYKHCRLCAGSAAASRRHHHNHQGSAFAESDMAFGSDGFHDAYRRKGSSMTSTPRLSSGGAMCSSDYTPSVSTSTNFLAGDEEGTEEEGAAVGGGDKDEAKEWVAQVEPRVPISFLSLPQGGKATI